VRVSNRLTHGSRLSTSNVRLEAIGSAAGVIVDIRVVQVIRIVACRITLATAQCWDQPMGLCNGPYIRLDRIARRCMLGTRLRTTQPLQC